MEFWCSRLHAMPSGSDCNVDCRYCFYKCRAPQVGTGRQRMSGEVLEKLVKDYMGLRFQLSGFAWQGGEPMLMGLDFYKRAVEFQKKYGVAGQEVGNSLQTNAILLNGADWCKFLHESKFLVGISIDGPKDLHDAIASTSAGTARGTVTPGIQCAGTESSTRLLGSITSRSRGEVRTGSAFWAFRTTVHPLRRDGPQTGGIAEFSVTPKQYGDFLCRMFDRWLAFGPQRLSIRDFDSILSHCVTGHQTICTFDRQCSQYIVVEHTGDVFPCDFFVEPKWRLGNLCETPIQELAACAQKKTFARLKQNLANKCLVCRYLPVCRGGCMKDRAPFDRDNFGRESYFCESYRRFFAYALPRFLQIAAQIRKRSCQTSAIGLTYPRKCEGGCLIVDLKRRFAPLAESTSKNHKSIRSSQRRLKGAGVWHRSSAGRSWPVPWRLCWEPVRRVTPGEVFRVRRQVQRATRWPCPRTRSGASKRA
jgi:uncharacterized protein